MIMSVAREKQEGLAMTPKSEKKKNFPGGAEAKVNKLCFLHKRCLQG